MSIKSSRGDGHPAALRREAEEQLKQRPPEAGLPRSEGELKGLVHELQVHQVELEIQNEELRRAKAAAEESATCYADLYDFAPVGYYTLDPAGEILSLNFAGARILGGDRSQLVGRSFLTFLTPDARQTCLDCLQAAVVESAKEACEVVLASSGESPVFLQLEVVASAGGAECLLAALDITALRRAEAERAQLHDQLSQAQKMEAIGNLAGGIAHDFNNILGAILGYSELAQQRLPEHSELAEDLGEVVRAGKRARDLVKQILAFSRKSGQERRAIQTHRIVGEAMRLVRQTIPANIAIEQNISKENDLIYADATQLHQVVMNLCTNAYHAVREQGGTINVDLQPVEVSPELAAKVPGLTLGPHVRLSISDTGVGMDPHTCSRACEPFFTTKPQGQGTGMGLAVVHGVVRRHEGHLHIESEMRRGTRVDIYLPRHLGHSHPQRDQVAPAPVGTERILLVDDEPMLVRVTHKLLTGLGYQVTSVSTSAEALDTFLQSPGTFDLVITDQAMPGMTGDALTREMLETRPDLPVIICTGYSETVNEENAREFGVKAVLNKPLDRGRLAAVVRDVLDGKSSEPEVSPPA